jgi:hypothetical protein
VVGHSQGGAAAWAVAQLQFSETVEGYLGAVAISPVTNILELSEPISSLLEVGMTQAIQAMFPDFQPESILTDDGVERLALVHQLGGCTATSLAILSAGGVPLTKPNWKDNEFVRNFQTLVVNGGKPKQDHYW